MSTGKRGQNFQTPKNISSSKKQDRKATPIKLTLEEPTTSDNDVDLFLNKLWPHLESKMDEWFKTNLPSHVQEAVSEAVNTAVSAFVSSQEFKLSLKDSIGFDLEKQESSLNEAKQEIEDLKKQINDINLKNDDLEQYSRRNNLRFSGIPEGDNENTDQLLCETLNKELNIMLNNNDICRSHRVGRKIPGKPRQIILKLTKHNTKVDILRKRKLLREKKSPIKINEDLTRARIEMIAFLYSTEKSKSLMSKLWTIDGTIFIRLARDTKIVKSFMNIDQCKQFINSNT